MSENISLVATYANHGLAEATVRKLKRSGFDISKLYVVSRNEGKSVAGAATVRGLSDLGNEQLSCIPRENVPDYEAELTVDRLILVAHGTPDEIIRAKSVIDTTHPEGWDGSVGCAIYYGCTD